MQAEALLNQNEDIAGQAAQFLQEQEINQQAEELSRETEEYLRAIRLGNVASRSAERSGERVDVATWVAETLDGNMTTEFSFTFDGEDFHDDAEPPRYLSRIFGNAIKDAEELAAADPKLAFELPRRYVEADELSDCLAMARGELSANTIIVESDFPYALIGATENVGGYNVTRQQTMQRVIIFADNTLTIKTQSLDRSNRQALEAIYRELEIEPQKGELQGQRIYKTLSPTVQEELSDKLREVYDTDMTAQYGEEFFAGRTPAERANTYEFVEAQDDLLDNFINNLDERDIVSSNKLRYQLAAAMEARWKGLTKRGAFTPADEMFLAGIAAEFAGKTYSGCGLTIDPSEAGYGNKSEESHCPFCGKTIKGVDPCSPNQKCKNKTCEAELKGGKVVYKGHAEEGKSFVKFVANPFHTDAELN